MINNTLVAAILLFAATSSSPYIHRVIEYSPAPGQFINEVPEIGSDPSRAAEIATEEIADGYNNGMVSLGAFGGYIIFEFDHPIVNVTGERDFKIFGNAFSNSAEPGIISVSRDVNGNGLPDDPWYEIAGSEHRANTVTPNYQITYFRPDPDATPTPDPQIPAVTNTSYILWRDNQGNEGYLSANTSHTQSYWPEWLGEQQELSFSASRLPDNAIDKGGKGNNWILPPFEYGYADNLTNNLEEGIDIADAIDNIGNNVYLPQIDFIKVHTALHQQCTWLGESSTEICGAIDLHPDAVSNVRGLISDNTQFFISYNNSILYISNKSADLSSAAELEIYDTAGNLLFEDKTTAAESYIPISLHGIYMIFINGKVTKLFCR